MTFYYWTRHNRLVLSLDVFNIELLPKSSWNYIQICHKGRLQIVRFSLYMIKTTFCTFDINRTISLRIHHHLSSRNMQSCAFSAHSGHIHCLLHKQNVHFSLRYFASNDWTLRNIWKIPLRGFLQLNVMIWIFTFPRYIPVAVLTRPIRVFAHLASLEESHGNKGLIVWLWARGGVVVPFSTCSLLPGTKECFEGQLLSEAWNL